MLKKHKLKNEDLFVAYQEVRIKNMPVDTEGTREEVCSCVLRRAELVQFVGQFGNTVIRILIRYF